MAGSEQPIIAPKPSAPVALPAADKKKENTPYNTELFGKKKRNIVSAIAADVGSLAVGGALQLVEPFIDLAQGSQGEGPRIRSKFLGGDDGYVYSYMGGIKKKTDVLSGAFRSGDISFGRGLIGSLAAGVEKPIELASWLTGAGEVKALAEKGISFGLKKALSVATKESLFRGGLIGGAQDVTSQLSKPNDFKAMQAVGSVAIGTVADLALTRGLPKVLSQLGLGISKTGDLVATHTPKGIKDFASSAYDKFSTSKAGQVIAAVRGKGTYLKAKFGEVGEEVGNLFQQAYKKFNTDIGKFHAGLIDLGIVKQPRGIFRKGAFAEYNPKWDNQEFRFDVRDAIAKTGRFADPATYEERLAADPDLKNIVNFFDGYKKDRGLLGQQVGVVENLGDIESYFSRYTPHVELQHGIYKKLSSAANDAEREALYAKNSPAVEEMIRYGMEREGKWKSMLEGYKNYYDAMDAVTETNRIPDNENTYFQWLVKNGQAKDIQEARTLLKGDINRITGPLTPRVTSFDYERQIPMPWNDPNPVRVMTKYMEDTNKRLAYAQQFGPNDEVIKEMVKKLQDSEGTGHAEELVSAFRQLTGQVVRDQGMQRFARLLNNVETLHLVGSALLNIPQILLYAMPTDSEAFFKGISKALSKKTLVESVERGTYLADLARQTRTMTTWNQKLADNVMKYSGFSHLDMLGKSVGSSIADVWASKALASLEKKLGRTYTPEERAALVETFAKDRAFQKKALREGFNIQKTNAAEFNKQFPGEDFVAVAGQRGRAKAYSEALTRESEKEIARLEKTKQSFENHLRNEGRKHLSQDEQIKAIQEDINNLQGSIDTYHSEQPTPSGDPVEEFSQRQVDDALKRAKELLIRRMNERLDELSSRFDEARAVGVIEGPDFQPPKLEGEQRVAMLHAKTLKIDEEIANAKQILDTKQGLLGNIIDSYQLAETKLASENPKVMEARAARSARKSSIHEDELKQYPEYHYLKELGLDPAEVLAKGHLDAQDLAVATQTLVESTQGSNNPLMTPLLAETAGGKMLLQFRKIVLQQSNFFLKQFYRNLVSKDTRSATNAIKFLTVAFVAYPPTMGVTRDIRDIMMGKKKPEEAFQFKQYWTSWNLISSTGLFVDFTSSFDNGREGEFFNPVAMQDGLKYVSGLYKTGKGLFKGDEEATINGLKAIGNQLLRQSGVGSIPLNYTKTYGGK